MPFIQHLHPVRLKFSRHATTLLSLLPFGTLPCAVSDTLELKDSVRYFHASSPRPRANPRSDGKKGRSRRRSKIDSSQNGRASRPKHYFDKWDWDDKNNDENPQKNHAAPLPINSLSLEWQLPTDITAAMRSDPTFFHGRNGLAAQWTPPSSASLSPEMVKVFQDIRRKHEMDSLLVDDDEEEEIDDER